MYSIDGSTLPFARTRQLPTVFAPPTGDGIAGLCGMSATTNETFPEQKPGKGATLLGASSPSGSEASKPADQQASTPSEPSFGPLQVAVVLGLLFVVISSYQYVSRDRILAWTRWIEHHRVHGGVVFVAVYATCLMLLLPGSILSLLGGALFGMFQGALLVWSGNVIGQMLSFLLARFVFRDVVRHQLEQRWPRFHVIDAALEKEGWRLVVVLRLSPIMPHAITNYVLGVTRLSVWTYTWSSMLSVVPYVVVFVYIGCLSKETLYILDGGWANGQTILPWGVLSGVLLIVLLVYGFTYFKRATQEALMEAVTPSVAASSIHSSALLSPRIELLSSDYMWCLGRPSIEAEKC